MSTHFFNINEVLVALASQALLDNGAAAATRPRQKTLQSSLKKQSTESQCLEEAVRQGDGSTLPDVLLAEHGWRHVDEQTGSKVVVFARSSILGIGQFLPSPALNVNPNCLSTESTLVRNRETLT